MKVLLVNGSSREKGCTYTALSEVAHSLEEEGIKTEIIFIGNKPLSDCTACGKCRETGECVFHDIANELVEKAKLPMALSSALRFTTLIQAADF